MGLKMNCWEFLKCGLRGKCKASTYKLLDGVHGGTNGGRACWVVKATLCGTVHSKKNCQECEFYISVLRDEGQGFTSPDIPLDTNWPHA